MKANYFFFLCASLLILLLGIFLHHGFHKKNFAFTAWIVGGCVSCFIAYIGMSLKYPAWMTPAGKISEAISTFLALAAISLGIARWGCPVNRTLVLGLAGMLAAQWFGWAMFKLYGAHQTASLETWLKNIGFFGPMLWMLGVFSGARFDRLMALVERRGPGFLATLRMTADAARSLLNG
jgi:hypothetical protein